MERSLQPDQAPTVKEALNRHPELAELLRGLSPDARLDWPALREHCRPGKPVDRLAAHVIILDYLRRPGS